MIEAMVVVSIIGIMAATVLPAITEMVASSKQSSAANELMLLAQRARSEAVLGGRWAYSIVFQENASGGDGAATIVTGLTAFCNRSSGVNFGNDPVTGITLPVGWQTVWGSVQLTGFSLGTHRVFASSELPVNTTRASLRICYMPNGEVHAFGPGITAGEQQDVAILRVRRSVEGQVRGLDREVVFVPGGTARTR